MDDSRNPEPQNISAVRQPKWTGVGTDRAVLVTRGEPGRTDAQMRHEIAGQVRRYLEQYPPLMPEPIPVRWDVVDEAIELIATDHIRPGTYASVTREQLLIYIGNVYGRRVRRDATTERGR